jgi:hypothetical protein
MAITDAQYQYWLASDNQRRIMLVELEYHDGSAVNTVYYSTSPYVSEPSDTPSNQPYDDAVATIPSFTRRLSNEFGGRGTGSWGDIEIINQNGALDAWLDYGFDGLAVRLYFGDASWPKSDFRIILAGTIADISMRAMDRYAVKIRDKSESLNIPIQASVIGGTDANADKQIPLLFGECYNITPLLIDAATHKYQYHDGAAQGVTTVYDNGVSVAFTDTPASGYFVLLASPTGQITCDAKGAKPGGVYLTKVADIASHIITTRSTLTSADVDSASLSAMNTTAPQTIGLYVTGRDNIINVLDSLVESVGGWWGFSRAGLLQMGVLVVPSGTPSVAMVADDIKRAGLSIKKRILPLSQVQIGYKKNWTVQSSGLAGSVSEARMAELAAEYLSKKATQSIPMHALAEQPDQINTLLIASADASAEATRRLALSATARHVFSIDAFSAPFSVELGAVVQITHPRFGFSSGALVSVVGIDEKPMKRQITIEVWK